MVNGSRQWTHPQSACNRRHPQLQRAARSPPPAASSTSTTAATSARRRPSPPAAVSTPDTLWSRHLQPRAQPPSNVPGFILTGYIIGNKIQLIEDQNDALNGVVGGVALSQGSNTGKFNELAPWSPVSPTRTACSERMPTRTDPASSTMAGGFGFNADGTVSGDWRSTTSPSTTETPSRALHRRSDGPRHLTNVVAVQSQRGNVHLPALPRWQRERVVHRRDDLETSGGLATCRTLRCATTRGTSRSPRRASSTKPARRRSLPSVPSASARTTSPAQPTTPHKATTRLRMCNSPALRTRAPASGSCRVSTSSPSPAPALTPNTPSTANRVVLMSIGQDQLGLMMLEGVTVEQIIASELTSPAPKGRALFSRRLFKREDKRKGSEPPCFTVNRVRASEKQQRVTDRLSMGQGIER